MSLRDTRYGPYVLLPKATPNDCESEEEIIALSNIQNAIARKNDLEKTRAEFVRLSAKSSSRNANTFYSLMTERINEINSEIASFETQISEILDSSILDNVFHNVYSRVIDEDIKALREKKAERQTASASTDVEANVATESVPVEQPEIPKRYSVKEKLINALGAAGGILWFILSSFVYILPILMIGKGFWLNLLFFGIMQIFPASSIVFWVWGLVGAITGPQDIFAIIYYVVFAVAFIPFFINIITGMFRKD